MKYTYNNYNNFVPVQVNNNIPDIPDFKDIPEDCTTIYDYFKLIFTAEMIEIITKESKKYIEEIFITKNGPDWKNKIYNRSSYEFLYINKGIESKDI